MELKIIRIDDQVTHLALIGRLDLPGVQKVEMPFTTHTATRRKPAVVDLSEVEFLSSLGVRMLLGGAKALHSRGVKLVLLNPQPQVLQVLQLGRIDDIISVETDLDRALARALAGVA